ncbi:MAG: signal peptide peptidase SppA [Deltaproteobacteria bacterium]|nr:signal peptide peptidase SppA [Deltaproteobacteria bacterium]
MSTRSKGSRPGLLAGAAFGIAAAGAFAWGLGCHGRPHAAPGSSPAPSGSAIVEPEEPDPHRPHVAELNLSSGVPEIYQSGLFGVPHERSFADLLQKLREISKPGEQRVKGVLVRFGSTSVGFSRAQELAEALVEVRASGKSVVCHADEYNNTSYWVAAAGCDRLWVSPAGGLDTVGIAAQLLYAKRLLGELKIDVDMLQVGRFKGASEPFTREGPSDEARESLMSVLRSIRGSWLQGMAKRMPKGADPALIEQGPYSPEEAKSRGLVDAVGYLEDAQGEARSRAGVDQVVARFGPGAKGAGSGALVGLVRVLSGAGGGFDVPHVTVVRAIGGIAMRSSKSVFGDDSGISEAQMARILERLHKDKSTRAVVLRIDSPGGSALASDLIWRRLMDLRKTRPVVVSVGDMAASGGYYLACTGTRVFAEPSSIVGSIGVVGGKFAFGRGLEHVGVHAETFAASDAPGARERAAYTSPFEPWDKATRERMLVTMTSVYDLFVRRVAEGRGLSADKVQGFAEGRIFSGADGVKLGMVDELGGLRKAIDYARSAAGLDPESPVRIVGESGGLQQLLEIDEEDAEEEARARAGSDPVFRTLVRAAAPELMGFARAFSPLIDGEHALVAVPFAFLVR